MKKIATLVPVLAAVAVVAFVVPLQAQASADPRRPGSGVGAAQHDPHPTPTGDGHPTGDHPTGDHPTGGHPTGGHTAPAATPSPDPTGGTSGPHNPGGPNGLGGTQPGGWHNPGNPNPPHCGTGQLVVDVAVGEVRRPVGDARDKGQGDDDGDLQGNDAPA